MRLLTILFAASLFAWSCSPSQPKAQLVLQNGHFFTADSLQPMATAVAILDGKLVYVGNQEGLKEWIDDQTEVIDLQGKFALPGLIEGHGHFSALGRSLRNLQLLHTRSWKEIIEAAQQKANQLPAGEWLEGRGWHQEKWVESPGKTVNGYPYHDALSEATPLHPTILYHASGHALLANQKAMELAGISVETPDPLGGRIVRDLNGRAIGVFEENAMELIERPLKEWKDKRTEAEKQAEHDTIVQYAVRQCLRYGITSFQDAGSSLWELQQYERLAKAGQLGMRLWAMRAQPLPSELQSKQDYPKVDVGNGFFTSRAVKAYFDGALGSYGAWLLAPYADKPDSYGQNTTPLDTIAALAQRCRELGLQFCVHAIGDRGNREVLNVFEQTGCNASLRWRVEHAQHIDPIDQPRFQQLGVIASMQAIHCTSDAPFVVKRLGEQRAKEGAYAWRSLLDLHTRMTNGTDTPVEEVDPFACLYASVTRRHHVGGPAFFPEQAMTREEALYSYTLWNAYAAFEENQKGSLKVGKVADIAVLDRNLLTCPADEMPQTKALMTILAGKIVYQDPTSR